MKIKIIAIFMFLALLPCFAGATITCLERFDNPYIFAISQNELGTYAEYNDVTIINGDFWDVSPGIDHNKVPGSYTNLLDIRASSGGWIHGPDHMLFRSIHNGVVANGTEINLQGHTLSGMDDAPGATRSFLALAKNGQIITGAVTGTIYGVANELGSVCPDILNAYFLDGGTLFYYNSRGGGCGSENSCNVVLQGNGPSYSNGSWSARYYIVITNNPERLPSDPEFTDKPKVKDRIFVPPAGTIGQRYALGNIPADTCEVGFEILETFGIYDNHVYIDNLIQNPSLYVHGIAENVGGDGYLIHFFKDKLTGYRIATDAQGNILGIGFDYYEDQVYFISNEQGIYDWGIYDARGYDYSHGILGISQNPYNNSVEHLWLSYCLKQAGINSNYAGPEVLEDYDVYGGAFTNIPVQPTPLETPYTPNIPVSADDQYIGQPCVAPHNADGSKCIWSSTSGKTRSRCGLDSFWDNYMEWTEVRGLCPGTSAVICCVPPSALPPVTPQQSSGTCSSSKVSVSLELDPNAVANDEPFSYGIVLSGEERDLDACVGKFIKIWLAPFDAASMASLNSAAQINCLQSSMANSHPIVVYKDEETGVVARGYAAGPNGVPGSATSYAYANGITSDYHLKYCAAIDVDGDDVPDSSEPHDTDGALLTVIAPEEIEVETCEAGWKCKDSSTLAFQLGNCDWINEKKCALGCEENECREDSISAANDEFITVNMYPIYSSSASVNLSGYVLGTEKYDSESEEWGNANNLSPLLKEVFLEERQKFFYYADFPSDAGNGIYRVSFKSRTGSGVIKHVFIINDYGIFVCKNDNCIS